MRPAGAALAVLLAGCAGRRAYECREAPAPPVIDGVLADAVWSRAPRSEPFVDIEGDAKPRPALATHVRLLWDADALYVAAEIEEPDVWATVTEHDAVIFRDDDFEVFLDPDGDARDYFEIEVNALGTVWDLFLPKPYSEEGSADNSWESGVRAAVHVDGVLDDASEPDAGWTVEMAIPWSAFAEWGGVPLPPRPGDEWRANFSRVDWDVVVYGRARLKPLGRPERNWVWSPMGVVDMHVPRAWGTIRFTR